MSSQCEIRGPKPARVTVWSGKATRLENLVLVDLLTGDITVPPKVTPSDGTMNLEGMPVRDYPLVVTDAAAVSG